MKKLLLSLMALSFMVLLTACGGKEADGQAGAEKTLTIAYQYGLAYAPLQVMKEQELIEKYYPDVKVEWKVLNSGAAINEGIASGNIDIGAMGVGPAVTAVLKGIPCKIFSNISSQPHALMTNREDINSLKDITEDNKIALVNVGSIQHILLAMAAKAELGDAHALDHNIVAMSHPDGMAALLAGSVDCQLTTSPYIFKEEAQGDIKRMDAISKVWPDGNSFIVGLASVELHDKEPELYQAVEKAMADAIAFMNTNHEEAAAMLSKTEEVEPEVILEWLSDPACGYSADTAGVIDMAQFMYEEGFIDKKAESFEQLAYDNVKGN